MSFMGLKDIYKEICSNLIEITTVAVPVSTISVRHAL